MFTRWQMHTNATMGKMDAHPKGKMSISFCRVYVFGCSSWTGAPRTIHGNPSTNPAQGDVRPLLALVFLLLEAKENCQCIRPCPRCPWKSSRNTDSLKKYVRHQSNPCSAIPSNLISPCKIGNAPTLASVFAPPKRKVRAWKNTPNFLWFVH